MYDSHDCAFSFQLLCAFALATVQSLSRISFVTYDYRGMLFSFLHLLEAQGMHGTLHWAA